MAISTTAFLVLSTAPFMRFGGGPRSIAALGDIDGDGRADYAVVGCSAAGSTDPTEAWICSGRDGHIVIRIAEFVFQGGFSGSIARAADIDGDGLRDVAISTTTRAPAEHLEAQPPVYWPWSGRVRIHSSRDGRLLRTLTSPLPPANDRFGAEIADVGDVDGDHVPDLLVGAPGVDRAFLFSGKTGALLRSIAPHVGGGEFGSAVCAGLDFDGDGRPDLAVGAPKWAQTGFVEILSGKDGHRLCIREGNAGHYTYGTGLGRALAMLDDVNADGSPELLIGADTEQDSGHLRAYSGVRSSELFDLEGDFSNFGRLGASIASARDIDGDGCADFFVGDTSISAYDEIPSHGPGCGGVGAYSGKTRKRLFDVYGDEQNDRLGFSVVCVGDLDGDGIDDAVAEASRYFRAISGKTGAKLYDVLRVSPSAAPPDDAKPK